MGALEQATTDDLIAELERRTDAMILAYTMPSERAGHAIRGTRANGPILTCLGLHTRLGVHLTQVADEIEEEAETVSRDDEGDQEEPDDDDPPG